MWCRLGFVTLRQRESGKSYEAGTLFKKQWGGEGGWSRVVEGQLLGEKICKVGGAPDHVGTQRPWEGH